MRWQTLSQAKWILLVLAVLTVAAWMLSGWAALVPAAMIVFTLYFFRDPDRTIPGELGLLVSPADGLVTDIGEMEEKEVTGERMLRVGIFLSVFDVHVNRAPATGRVVYTAEHPGNYHDARSPMASTHNAARTWAFDCDGTILVVRQITGAIARRIVPWALLGDRLARGEHFGMIRFGSRTEIFVPPGTEISVKIGQHVKGGSTVLGRLAAGGGSGNQERAKETVVA
ncbi:MAG: phosphatidylserine decarboxylase family protein [Chthoniobacterales bacterium]|nr:phosphatidylserine decarboxylase family protein [Chthoniobacterales bacterium]